MEQFGETLIEKERQKDALLFLKAAIDMNPNAPGQARRYAMIGRAQASLGMHEQSAEAYRSAIQLDLSRQTEPEIDLLLAETYLRGMRSPDLALAHLQQAFGLPVLAAQREPMALLVGGGVSALGRFCVCSRRAAAVSLSLAGTRGAPTIFNGGDSTLPKATIRRQKRSMNRLPKGLLNRSRRTMRWRESP